jgi:hypothetical protein
MKDKKITFSKFILLFLIAISFSCKLSKKERSVIGKWEIRRGSHIGNPPSHIGKVLIIKGDGTYLHNESCLVTEYSSYGKWFIKGDTLTLVEKQRETNDPEDTTKNRDTLFMKLVLSPYTFPNGSEKDYLEEIKVAKKVQNTECNNGVLYRMLK